MQRERVENPKISSGTARHVYRSSALEPADDGPDAPAVT
eukprot:XP_001704418.1 Hypothetical protein GL50803_846 [Giardia lamblia ATCC 50803]